jgi:hypothetical protein
MPEEKLTDDRLARLYGALAGLGIGATSLQKHVQGPLGALTELGIEPYVEGAYGLPLWAEDIESHRRLRAYQKHLKAEKLRAIASEAHMALPPQSIEFARRYPWVFGGREAVEALSRAEPAIFVRSPNPAAIAHEVGHTVRSPISTAALISRHPLLRALGMGGGVAAALSDEEGLQAVAPAISVAPHIPELAEEARASLHGARAIRATEGATAALKALGRLTPAFMTYLAAALPALAAPYVAKGIKEHVKKKRAEKTAQALPKATGKTIVTARQRWAAPTPKPKSSKPGKAKSMPPAQPPSKRKFFTDLQKQMEGLGARKPS